MFDKSNEIYKQTYEREWKNSLKLIKNNCHLHNIDYFCKIAEDYFTFKDKDDKKVVCAGVSFPEEILLSLGINTKWILGGSLGTYDMVDSIVPRDVDAVHQSILGYLKCNSMINLDKTKVLLPITCDSMRKISNYLNKDNCIKIDIPPDKKSLYSKDKWIMQMRKVLIQIQTDMGKIIDEKSFDKVSILLSEIRREIRRFYAISQNSDKINGSCALFILNTYYFTNDLHKWLINLRTVNGEIEESSINNMSNYNSTSINKEKNEIRIPKVLVIGSPIYFPNYKVPFLLEEVGLRIKAVVNEMTEKIYVNYGQKN